VREVVSFAGSPGTGKSTKLRECLARHMRAVVVDPAPDKDDAWRKAGYVRVLDLPDLSAAIAHSFRGRWRMVWTPPADKTGEALHAVSDLLFRYQERERAPRPIALGVDEMAECYSNDQARRAKLPGFRRLLLQGRHLEVSIYGASQRPQDVAALFRDMADQAYFFELYSDTGREAVLGKIGRKGEAQYLSLRPFEYLFWKRGQIAIGRTRKGA
jgi:hypothetical protein